MNSVRFRPGQPLAPSAALRLRNLGPCRPGCRILLGIALLSLLAPVTRSFAQPAAAPPPAPAAQPPAAGGMAPLPGLPGLPGAPSLPSLPSLPGAAAPAAATPPATLGLPAPPLPGAENAAGLPPIGGGLLPSPDLSGGAAGLQGFGGLSGTPAPTPTVNVTGDLLTDSSPIRKATNAALEKIREQYNNGQFEAAITAIDAALAKDPSSPVLKLYKGMAKQKILSGNASTSRLPSATDVQAQPPSANPRPTGPSTPTSPSVPAVATRVLPGSSPARPAPSASGSAPPAGAQPSTAAAAAAPPAEKVGWQVLAGLGAAVVLIAALAFNYLSTRKKRLAAQRAAEEAAIEARRQRRAAPGSSRADEIFASATAPVGRPAVAGLAGASALGLSGETPAENTHLDTQALLTEATNLDGELPFGTPARNTLHEAHTQVPEDAEEESDDKIAQRIGERLGSAKPASLGAPGGLSFDLPTNFGADQDSVFHEGLATNAEGSLAHPSIDASSINLGLGEDYSQPPAPAAPAAIAAAGSDSGRLSLDSLGISASPPAGTPPMAEPEESVVRLDFASLMGSVAPDAPAAAPAPAPRTAETAPAEAFMVPPASIPAPPASIAAPPVAAPAAASPENINLQDLLFGRIDSPSVSGTATSPGEASAPVAPGADQTGDSMPGPDFAAASQTKTYVPPLSMQAPPPAASSPAEATGEAPPIDFEALAETLHSQRTQVMPAMPPTPEAIALDAQLGETVGVGGSGVGAPPVAMPELQNPAPAADEAAREEKMFQEMLSRGKKAVAEKNWKEAVRYLSTASATRPDNNQVRTLLILARDAKRDEEEAQG